MKRIMPALIVALSLLATGCSDSENSDQVPVTSAALNGSTFTATGVEGFELDEQVPLTISFDQDTLSIDAGCNSVSGGYQIEDCAIRAGLISTLMGCPPPLDEIERRTTGLLSDGARASLQEDTLTLSGKNGVELTLER